jgi:sugar/nucleoside kinase (ribokinase family)
MTRGAEGSMVSSRGTRIEVAAEPVARVVDTTGAGDLYAAGFLFGMTHGHDLATSARLGSVAAGEVISHVGARPETVLAGLAAPLLV